jgi:trehalose 6-phosphate phosphatase
MLAFDFDGTLTPIVADRAAARVSPRTLTLLESVCALYPCAVISGRSRADVAPRLGKARVKHVIGNHGIEPGFNLGRFERSMRQALARLQHSLSEFDGIEFENKRYSLAIHYRKSGDRRRALSAIKRAISELASVRSVPGKLVVNVVPLSSPHKGDALVKVRQIENADTVLYVGDDITDEDVFRLAVPGLIAIRVGKSLHSAAPYYIASQSEIDRLLARLLDLKQK